MGNVRLGNSNLWVIEADESDRTLNAYPVDWAVVTNASADHFDVDELFLRLRNKGSRVSKASIYRNIPLIMECGLIKEVWHEDGHMHYEPIFGQSHHCHLRCIKCGKVVEFVEDELQAIEERLARKHNFLVVDHRLDVIGYCTKCRKGH